jgi:hypothetical protein
VFSLRDRPFNLKGRGGYGFLFRSEFFFSNNTRVRIFIFFVAQSAKFFFQNSTLGYMTKTLNQIFFFLHQNQNIFSSNIGNQNIFFMIFIFKYNKMKNKKYHTVGTFPKSNRKIVDRGRIDSLKGTTI